MCQKAWRPAPKTVMDLKLFRRQKSSEEQSPVRKAVTSSAFRKPVGVPLLDMIVRAPWGVMSAVAAVGPFAPGVARVTTMGQLVSYYLLIYGVELHQPFIPIPEELVDGMKRVVFPLGAIMAVRSGWCIAHAASPCVPVEYSCRAFRRDFCRAWASSMVSLSRTSQTSASVRTVRDIVGNGHKLDCCDKEAWKSYTATIVILIKR